MRFEDLDGEEPRPINVVGLGFTYDEARELHDSLHLLLDEPADRHEHVSGADHQRGATVFIVDEDGRPLGQRDLYKCPVCGYEGFEEPPWRNASASQEICPSCGIQFGYTDAAGGDVARRVELHQRWRKDWIAEGMPWRGARRPPEDWDPEGQLRSIAGDEEPGSP